MTPEYIQITAFDGELDINTIDQFLDGELTIKNEETVSTVVVSEPYRIVIDNDDIVTGNIYITADQNIEVIRVLDKGPKGDKGDRGEQGTPGVNGAGEPFFEVIPAVLYQSTASVSVFSDFYVTGSAYVTEDLITLGRLGINTNNPSSFFDVRSDNGQVDLVKITSASVDYFKVNNDGVVVFGDFPYVPEPVAGGIYYRNNRFYIGI